MRALFLDFEHNAPGAKLGYALISAGGLIATLVLSLQLMVHKEIERYDETAPRATRAQADWGLPRGVASEAEALTGARAVVTHLAGPWEALFRTLESIEARDVALLALTPDNRQHQIRIYAEARSLGAMLSYYGALERSRAFADVVLLEHEIQRGDPQRPVRFTMTAAWGDG